MSEPFLDTDYVRNEFIRGAYSEREMSLEFDRWLDQVKADAWDEGAKAIKSCLTTAVDGSIVWDWETEEPTNPYRKQEEA